MLVILEKWGESPSVESNRDRRGFKYDVGGFNAWRLNTRGRGISCILLAIQHKLMCEWKHRIILGLHALISQGQLIRHIDQIKFVAVPSTNCYCQRENTYFNHFYFRFFFVFVAWNYSLWRLSSSSMATYICFLYKPKYVNRNHMMFHG